MPMAVVDQVRGLELQGGLGHAGAPHSEHVGNEFLRHRQVVGGQPVDAQQQPSAQLLPSAALSVPSDKVFVTNPIALIVAAT
ncbi:hypothetical protein D9M69_357160 [compost metagenome]